jgi:phosphatidylglycerophosphatase A
MDKSRVKLLYSRLEMQEECLKALESRGVDYRDIAHIAYLQQTKFSNNVSKELCEESVLKILSLRDIFHTVLLGIEIDRLVEEKSFKGPIQDIMMFDLGVFGVDEALGLTIASQYGVIGQTNFGDIDVNKPGIVGTLNEHGKGDKPVCHTMLDDIVGAIAAAASTRVAQVQMEEQAKEDLSVTQESLF